MSFTHLPLRRSIPFGAIAYVIGYVLTVAVMVGRVSAVMAVEVSRGDVDPEPLGQLLSIVPSPWVVGGWVFYNAHYIPTSVPTRGEFGAVGGLTNRHLLLAVDGGFFALYLVPALLLIAAGYLVVRTGPIYGARGATYGGASVVFGYLLLLVIGAFVFTAPTEGATVASPDGLQTIWVGLVYPVIFGAVGGKLAGSQQEDSEGSGAREGRKSRW